MSPDWRPGTRKLVDHAKSIKDQLSSDEISSVAKIFYDNKAMIGNGNCAFVVSDSVGFGLIRMYELFGGELVHPQARVFYSIEEAVDWLRD